MVCSITDILLSTTKKMLPILFCYWREGVVCQPLTSLCESHMTHVLLSSYTAPGKEKMIDRQGVCSSCNEPIR